MDQVIAHQGEQGGDRPERGVDVGGVYMEGFFCDAAGEQLVKGVEADVGDQRDDEDQQCPDISELRPGLDHLRQSELRTLGGVKGHEEGSEGAAGEDRNGGPIRLPPNEMPSTPTAMVARWASPVNQMGHRCQTLPCRSARGT